MNAKRSIVLAGCVALLLSACGSSPQSLIVGKWDVAGAKIGGADVVGIADAIKTVKMSAEFSSDGTAKITMFGQTLQGTYKFDGSDLEWTLSGITTKSKAHVTATELELTDEVNRTITYKRK